MKKQSILYLNYTSILTQGILLSQVVIPLKKLGTEGYRITLVSGERIEDLAKRKERESLHRELEQAGVELVFFRKDPSSLFARGSQNRPFPSLQRSLYPL